jgi:hypothetical protein
LNGITILSHSDPMRNIHPPHGLFALLLFSSLGGLYLGGLFGHSRHSLQEMGAGSGMTESLEKS